MTAAAADKLVLLSTAARFDLCATCGPASQVDAGEMLAHAITRLFHPDGSCFSVFKVLMTEVCQYDCLYCANRAGRSCRRHSSAPDELAATFVDLHERGLVTGLFLSSGVKGSPADAMGDMLTAVEILREKHRFSGYVHLKVLPGAPYDCVERAVELADRVSVNVEAPSQRALDHLATTKRLSEDIIQRMHWIRRASERAGPDALKAGQTTQFVVGPGDSHVRCRPAPKRGAAAGILLGLQPGAGNTLGGGTGRAAAPTAPSLPGRLAAAGVRVRTWGHLLRRERQTLARHGSEDCVRPPQPTPLSDGGESRDTGGAAESTGRRAAVGRADSGRAAPASDHLSERTEGHRCCSSPRGAVPAVRRAAGGADQRPVPREARAARAARTGARNIFSGGGAGILRPPRTAPGPKQPRHADERYRRGMTGSEGQGILTETSCQRSAYSLLRQPLCRGLNRRRPCRT